MYKQRHFQCVCVCCGTDEIEFEVGTDSRTNKLIARRLVRLPAGTVSFESISEERLLGKVDCEPRVVSTPSGGEGGGGGGKGNRVSGRKYMYVYELLYVWGELASHKRLFNPPSQFSRLGT